MTDCKNRKDGECCGKPEDPKECSEEQIKECHGDEDKHPCDEKCCEKKEED
jgi:hypothetical protein